MAMVWIKWIILGLLALALLFVALGALGTWRWAAATRGLTERLDAARSPVTPARYNAARELQGLPAPVQRYFRAALRDGQPMLAAVNIEHRGTFNLAAEGPEQWRPFSATQRVTLRRPGFVWDARVNMLPGVAVHVHDAYVAGEGLLRPAVLGLFLLAELRGSSPESGGLAEGEFMRWFAEAAWYPSALLPSQGVRWSEVDEHSAQATAGDGALAVTLLFRFDPPSGLIASVRAEARGRMLGRTVLLTPWEGRWSAFALRDGMRVPLVGEVAWLSPEGRKPYWRGTLSTLRYEFAP